MEYGIYAASSEDMVIKVTKDQDQRIITAIRQNEPKLLMLQSKNKSNKKKESALALIRSDGKKRKFFLRDEEVRRNLNRRQ